MQWVPFGDGLDGIGMHDWFGYSLSLGADFLVVGAPKSSYVRVFHLIQNTTVWELIGNQIDGQNPNDFFGGIVFMSSDGFTFCVGAPYNTAMENNTGVVSTYELVDGLHQFNERGNLYGKNIGGEYGSSLSVSGDGKKIAVGGNEAYIYELQSGVWKSSELDVQINVNVVVGISND